MKRTGMVCTARTTVAIACTLALTSAYSIVRSGDVDAPTTSSRVPRLFDGPSGVNLQLTSTPSGFISDLFGKNDYGRWLCTNCTIIPGDPLGLPQEELFALMNYIRNVVFGGTFAGFMPGDQVTVCNGSWCLDLKMNEYRSWGPKDGINSFKPDPKKGYKNPSGTTVKPRADNAPIRKPVTIIVTISGQAPMELRLIDDDSPLCCVTIGPPEVVPEPAPPPEAPPGDFGKPSPQPSCVHVDSRLPDGRRAGDIRKGDTMQLGDENTLGLETRVGIVSHSVTKRARGFKITTQSGISLVCSDTAPIWTDEGYVTAPGLHGRRVATRVDHENIVTRYETVETVEDVGEIDIQHITVGNRAFWAGADHGAYLLHHNLKEDE